MRTGVVATTLSVCSSDCQRSTRIGRVCTDRAVGWTGLILREMGYECHIGRRGNAPTFVAAAAALEALPVDIVSGSQRGDGE